MEAARTLARVDGKVEAGQRKKWEMSLPDNDFTKEVKAQFKAIYGNREIIDDSTAVQIRAVKP